MINAVRERDDCNTNATARPRDLVVVGGGFAGLTTALRAAELGLSVTLVERGTDRSYPCNTRFSGGILHLGFRDVRREPDDLYAHVVERTEGTARDDLAHAVADDGRRLLAWLRGHGVKFMRFSWQEAHRWGMAPPRPVGAGLNWRGRGPDAMIEDLTKAFVDRGGELLLGHRAIDLIMKDERCAGIVTEADGRQKRIDCSAVAICDGGYQANRELLRTHVGPAVDSILQRGAATGTGDGLGMAERAGAAISGLGRFYGHLQGRRALDDTNVWPYPELDSVAAATILVGRDGRRLTDEGLGGMAISNAIACRSDPTEAVIICDSACWEGPGRGARVPANPFLEKFGGDVFRAATLSELAAVSGVDPQGLEATVAGYNEALAKGAGEELDPPRSTRAGKAFPVSQAPFLAIPVCVGITYTMGGIVVDGAGRVLNREERPIPGLYAAGTTTAGLEGGGSKVGYVGGLIKAVFGLRAAEDIASRRDGRG